MEPKIQIERNSSIEHNRTITSEDRTITFNGTKYFVLHSPIQEIESKLGIDLKLSKSTDECYINNSNSNLQLLFLRDTLISIDFFDSSYQTNKGFRVGDKISKLMRTHPEVKYHESTSNMVDESYYVTTKSYTTQSDSKGNAFTFHVSDSDPNTISIITVTNYIDDHSPCNAY